MKILTVDPGIDDVGVALWKAERGKSMLALQDSLRCLIRTERIQTDARDPIPVRLAHISRAISDLVIQENVAQVYVEMPPYEGSYSGGKERRPSVNKLYLAIGAIFGAAAVRTKAFGVPVVKTPKEMRLEILETAAKHMDLELPKGPRGGEREDEMDAVWIGVQVLQGGSWRRENTGKNRGKAS